MHASADEVKAAYKKLAMKYHPDRNKGSIFHEEHFKRILEAYQVLSDKYERDMYDLRMFYDATKKATSSTASSSSSSSASKPAAGPNGDIYGTSGRYARSYANQQQAKAQQQGNKNRPDAEPVKKQPKWYLRAHVVVIAFWITACCVMLWYWGYATYQHNEAIKYLAAGRFTEAVEADPYFPEAYLARAKALMGEEEPNYVTAIYDLSQAIKYQDGPDAIAFSLRAECYAKTGSYDLAIDDLEFALSLKPHEPDFNLRMGELYVFNIKAPIKAQPFLDTVLLFAKPQSEPIYKATFALGYGAMIDGNMAKALTYFNQAAVLPQADNALFYLMGHANERLGNFVDACNDWDKAKIMGNQEAAIQYDAKHCAYRIMESVRSKKLKSPSSISP